MADPLRFPGLALPFALMGAAAGWLSASLVRDPLFGFDDVRISATVFASVAGACCGAVSRRLAVGRRYAYELPSDDALVRPRGDSDWLHALTIVIAGAATGAAIAPASSMRDLWMPESLAGALCALVFVPVALVVIEAARRAQRARLGTLVAASDRRAVWAILAIALGVATLESAPSWPVRDHGAGRAPEPALAMLALAAIVVGRALASDLRARRVARVFERARLTRADDEPADASIRSVDLGLGDDRGALLPEGGSPYRGGARPMALVLGSRPAARAALDAAVLRGVAGLAGLAVVLSVHAAATSPLGERAYAFVACRRTVRYACNAARAASRHAGAR